MAAQLIRRARVAPPVPHFFGSDLSTDDVIGLLGHAFPRQFKPVGSSSVVFRMRLDGPITGAYRPRSRMHPRGHLAEIAAYRVARLLGMDQVPPAVSRRVSRSRLRSRLHPDFIDAWDDVRRAIRWDDDGTTEGAAVYWIPRMRDLQLERADAIERWSGWLSQGGEIPQEREELASDISQCIVFDYLIGNWDRFSGGNMLGTRDGSRLFIRDHNLAFEDPLPEHLHGRIWRRLVQTERFSRRQVEALLTLDARSLRAEMDRDPISESRRVLTAAQVRGLLDRRQAILSHVAELSSRLGENRVLTFP
ncbi:MAG: hypothetical protein GXP55_11160 [Deltaproteobacteria bacterium]|nr:hypothetical protein [Deltaproteobacteria bacterium]